MDITLNTPTFLQRLHSTITLVFFVTDTRIFPRWEQQFEAQRKCQQPGFRHGESKERQSGVSSESVSQHTGYQFFHTTGKLTTYALASKKKTQQKNTVDDIFIVTNNLDAKDSEQI